MATETKKKIPGHVYNKRDELIWSLSDASQGYAMSEIAWMFGISKTLVFNIIKRKPKDWSSPWIKIR
jgi:hypothetical protein